MDKVKICKTTKPSGTICVDPGSVINLLNSGGYLGACQPSVFSNSIMLSDENEIISKKLSVQALPNPTADQFTLRLSSGSEERISLKVVDVLGRAVEVREGIANSTMRIGANYRPGLYIVEVVQGSERILLKLVKQPD